MMPNLNQYARIINSAPNGYQSWYDYSNGSDFQNMSFQDKVNAKKAYEAATGVIIPEVYGETGDLMPWEEYSAEASYQHLSGKDKANAADAYEKAGGFIPWYDEVGKTIHRYSPTMKGTSTAVATDLWNLRNTIFNAETGYATKGYAPKLRQVDHSDIEKEVGAAPNSLTPTLSDEIAGLIAENFILPGDIIETSITKVPKIVKPVAYVTKKAVNELPFTISHTNPEDTPSEFAKDLKTNTEYAIAGDVVGKVWTRLKNGNTEVVGDLAKQAQPYREVLRQKFANTQEQLLVGRAKNELLPALKTVRSGNANASLQEAELRMRNQNQVFNEYPDEEILDVLDPKLSSKIKEAEEYNELNAEQIEIGKIKAKTVDIPTRMDLVKNAVERYSGIELTQGISEADLEAAIETAASKLQRIEGRVNSTLKGHSIAPLMESAKQYEEGGFKGVLSPLNVFRPEPQYSNLSTPVEKKLGRNLLMRSSSGLSGAIEGTTFFPNMFRAKTAEHISSKNIKEFISELRDDRLETSRRLDDLKSEKAEFKEKNKNETPNSINQAILQAKERIETDRDLEDKLRTLHEEGKKGKNFDEETVIAAVQNMEFNEEVTVHKKIMKYLMQLDTSKILFKPQRVRLGDQLVLSHLVPWVTAATGMGLEYEGYSNDSTALKTLGAGLLLAAPILNKGVNRATRRNLSKASDLLDSVRNPKNEIRNRRFTQMPDIEENALERGTLNEQIDKILKDDRLSAKQKAEIIEIILKANSESQ
ncbi:hypothetical protein [Klebsiella pneumoniae]|uniref:hypothetical protein n=1 Tax=Klebsiella pneumoniae TaxID=573 RepID=UPI0022308DDD|nr:hypothetical protein [Klebsiella pneumoniae]MDM9063542.1 hypothetical protein [Klebsiella pneumoniae]